MSLIFDTLKQHENHDISCLQKGDDYVVICRTCKKDILVFGEPKPEECFIHDDADRASFALDAHEHIALTDDDDEYLSIEFDDLGPDDEE